MHRLRRSFDRYWYAWAMVAPVVIVLAVLVFYPLVQGIWMSFTNLNEANQIPEICRRTLGGGETCSPNPDRWQYVGLANYADLFTGQVGDFWRQLRTTMIWTFSCVFLHYTLGLALAMMLHRPLRGRGVYRVLLILPWAIPAFVSAFAWKFIFDRDRGIINALLQAIGVQQQPYDWLENGAMALVVVIIVNVWLGVPFMMVALLGGLQAVPTELYEAAEMDGASPWQRFTNITLPSLRPVSASVILLGTIWTFNMFPIIFLVTRGGPAGATDILVTGAFKAAFEGLRNYSLAASYGVVILAILIVYSIGYRFFLRKQGEVW